MAGRSPRQARAPREAGGERQRRRGLHEVLRQPAAAVHGDGEGRGPDPKRRDPEVRAPPAGHDEHDASDAANEPERIEPRLRERERQKKRIACDALVYVSPE